MKYLLLFAAVVIGLHLLKQQPGRAPSARRRAAPKAPEAMLECRRCGVLVPASRAVHGADGVYCCDAHARPR